MTASVCGGDIFDPSPPSFMYDEYAGDEPGQRPAIGYVQGVPLLFRVCRLCGSDIRGLLPVHEVPVAGVMSEDQMFVCCEP